MKTVLVVDDEVVIRRLVGVMLSGSHFQVVEAGDGNEALRVATDVLPDVALVDIGLPGVNGIDLCRALKSSPLTSSVRVVMMTGDRLPHEVDAALEAGAAEVLGKPFTRDVLRTAVGLCSDGVLPEATPSPTRGTPIPSFDAALDDATLRDMDADALRRHVVALQKAFAERLAHTRETHASAAEAEHDRGERDLYLSLVCHRFRDPLSIVRGYSELVAEALSASGLEASQNGLVGAVTRSAREIETLVDELSDFSRASGAGSFLERSASVQVTALVRLVAREMLPVARARAQQMRIEVAREGPPLEISGERLREAMTHLMRSALLHTPRGGEVCVSCEEDESGATVVFTDGRGAFAHEPPERLFLPVRSAGLGGAGAAENLGLCIARHIIEHHGGSISATSESNRGACITVRLPRGPRTATIPRSPRDNAQASSDTLARDLDTAERNLFSYAQDLAARLAQESLRAQRLEESLAEMEQTYLETIAALANATDTKDAYKLGHTERVAQVARAIAQALNPALLSRRDFEYSLLLHDLGKIGIAEDLLQKAGKLSDAEWETVKSHSELGARLLSSVRFLAPALAAVRSHHERFDGKGYPDGLRGEEIPLTARIIAVADAFEAMISDRPYRKGLSLAEARDQIKANSGTQFDPEVVGAFLDAWKRIEAQANQADATGQAMS